MSKTLELHDVSIRYGDFTAVNGVSLQLEQGQIGCLLGPSGCGKSTLLRAIAGFEPVSAGEIRLAGERISGQGTHRPPEQRRVGMVFQDFALFPHLDVQRNVGFGLRRLGRDERRARVAQMLALVGLSNRARAMPHELSGGQQQRVALARALAAGPQILLLDEPFSSLDSELREDLAMEVRELLKRQGITAIMVTHDQQEAFAMADDITLMESGRVAQRGSARQLYREPAGRFVARFIGRGSELRLRIHEDGGIEPPLGQSAPEHWPRGDVNVLLRPENVHRSADGIELPIAVRSFHGGHYRYRLTLADGQQLECDTPLLLELSEGESLRVRAELGSAILLPAD